MACRHNGGGVDGVSLVESSTNGPAARGSCLSTTHELELRLGVLGVEPGAVTGEAVGSWHTVGP